MPQRAVNLVLVVAGVATVALLMVLGVDLARAANRGPRWKRRMVGAGLLLLGTLGLAPANPGCMISDVPNQTESVNDPVATLRQRIASLERLAANEKAQPAALENALESLADAVEEMESEEQMSITIGEVPPAEARELRKRAAELTQTVRDRLDGQPGPTLAASPQWKRLIALWQTAEEIATFQRGGYPYSDAEQNRLIHALKQAQCDTAHLAAHSLLEPEEAAAIRIELATLIEGVHEVRPKELRNASCYFCGPINVFGARPAEQIADRLPLLEKMVASDHLRPEVAERVLSTVERDIANLDESRIDGYVSEQQNAWRQARQDAEKLVKKIRSRLGIAPMPLQENATWRRITATWDEGIREAKKGGDGFDWVNATSAKLQDTHHLLVRLWIEGRITQTELGLLRAHSLRLEEDLALPSLTAGDREKWRALCAVRRLCYQLPLVQKLPGDSTRQPVILKIILTDVETASQVLSEPGLLRVLKTNEPQDQGALSKELNEVPALLKQSEEAVRTLKGMIGASP